jgi:hypothetical protein
LETPALAEAEEHLAALVVKSQGVSSKAILTLRSMAAPGTVVGREV